MAREHAKIDMRDAEIAHGRTHRVDRHARQAHVLRDREVGNDGGVLVDGDDAGLARLGRRTKQRRLSAQSHLAGIGGKDAGDDLDQRRLAGAVGAHQRMNFARQYFEIGRTQRGHGPEGLGDATNA